VKELEEIWAASNRLCNMDQDYSTVSCFDHVLVGIHNLCSRITLAEQAGCDKAEILVASETARTAHRRSPFIHRLQTWPRGYPGDFETIEYILSQQVRSPSATLEFWIEYYALGTMIAQQHRNKVMAQARELTRILSSDIQKPRILIIAAGSSPDLLLVEPLLKQKDCEIVLNDGDKDALEFSLERLKSSR
jgi:extracellular factor (EF) 3-hydroxypalmitic acid methyl ester biosynthesis protein